MKNKYEVVFLSNKIGGKSNLIMNIEELKNYTLSAINEKGYCIGSVNQEFFIQTNKEIVWNNDIEEDIIFAICSGILLEINQINVLKITSEYKILIRWLLTTPNSKSDNDQIFYQMGYENNDVSRIEIYKNNEFLFAYGSKVCGEQEVGYYTKDGETETIKEDPELIRELFIKQIKDKKQYLYFSLNCWLERYFIDSLGNDLSLQNEDIQAQCEMIHSTIAENLSLDDEVIGLVEEGLNILRRKSITEDRKIA